MGDALENKQKCIDLAKQAHEALIKIIELIDKDTDCVSLIHEIDKATALLKDSKKSMLNRYLNQLLTKKTFLKKEETITELMKIYHFK